jgi:hypothetical protein
MSPSAQGMQELIDHMPKGELHQGPQDQEVFGFEDRPSDEEIVKLAEEEADFNYTREINRP